MFSMIAEINESKTLTKHISCKCKCKFDERECSSNQRWNNGKCWCECKKRHICEKDYIWNPATCSYKNGKYLATGLEPKPLSSLNHLVRLQTVSVYELSRLKFANELSRSEFESSCSHLTSDFALAYSKEFLDIQGTI